MWLLFIIIIIIIIIINKTMNVKMNVAEVKLNFVHFVEKVLPRFSHYFIGPLVSLCEK